MIADYRLAPGLLWLSVFIFRALSTSRPPWLASQMAPTIRLMPTLSREPPSLDSLAAELMRHLEVRVALDPDDEHPYKVTVVRIRTDGNEFTVVYRHKCSPQFLGRRGDAIAFSKMFEPPQAPDQLAAILLQNLSEPSGQEQIGSATWAVGMVPDRLRCAGPPPDALRDAGRLY